MNTPRVFIGIPTLNRPEYVKLAVNSVRAQSLQDWRMVVSDNASRADASEAVKAFLEELADPRISYWRQPKNIREYGNCEWLFRQCREEFFVILHDDDILDPAHLETAVAHLDAQDDIVCFCANASLIDSAGHVSEERTSAYRRARGREGRASGPIRILEPLMRTGFVPICGTVIRSAALRESGFVDDDCFGLWPFEVNLLLRLGERGGLAWFHSGELLRFRFHEGQMQRYQGISSDPVAVGMFLKLMERRRFDGDAEHLRKWLLAVFYNFQARIFVRRGDMTACRRALRRAIRMNPWWMRHWPLAACAFLLPPLTAMLVRRIDARP